MKEPNKRLIYPPNVKRFVSKWQPTETQRQKAFWKEFRKAANAYSKYQQSDSLMPVQFDGRIIMLDVSPMTVDEFKTAAIRMLEAHIEWSKQVFPFITSNALAMAARKKSTESTGRVDRACHQRLVRRLRRRYTRVVKRGDVWACFLQIDHQGFCVVDDTEKAKAEWYSLQLAKALARMISTNRPSTGEPGKPWRPARNTKPD